MKAARLRAGHFVLVAALLAFGIVAVRPVPAFAAAEDLQSALDDYAAGRYEVALKKLREYVASNPGDEEVYQVLRSADEHLLLKVLALQGDNEALMKVLLNQMKPVSRARHLDTAKIQELVNTAVTDPRLDNRREAQLELRSAGDLAVPYLYGYLARSDAEVVVNAMFALHRLGSSAVMPLVQVLKSDNARMAATAAAVLGDIGDPVALPGLLALAGTTQDPGAKEKAMVAVQKIVGDRAATLKAPDSYVRWGMKFYANDPSVIMGFDDVRNLWRWEDGDLVRYTIPSWLFPGQMAEQMALDALSIEPQNRDAQALLVRSLLLQKVEAEATTSNGGTVPDALQGVQDVAASQGFDAATEALRGALRDRDWDVAVQAIQVMVQTYAGEPLANSPLGAALVAPETRVNYAAAIAALQMSPQSGLPNADKVANLAARAASERAVRQVLVIDPHDDARSKLDVDLAHAGYVVAGVRSGAEGVARAKLAPTLDVIIVRADLSDPQHTPTSQQLDSAIGVIDELKSDVRTKEMRVIVLLGGMEGQGVDTLKDFFQKRYGDKVAGFLNVPLDTSVVAETVNAAAEAGNLNPDRERANQLAARAAEAFATTDFTCRAFDLSVAVDPLSTAATEGPTPDVKLWATRALGNVCLGGADALVKNLSEGADDALKAAAATALGRVLAKQPGTPEQIQALIDAAAGEGDVAKAALEALGTARGLTPEQRRDLFKAHRPGVAEKAPL